ncbi:hypothetical protein HZC00_00540 [Candidatus Kaiserbacteria bacterium]|nr:hypothetical protein [Candidatus Kaiserbacteria bacterium]
MIAKIEREFAKFAKIPEDQQNHHFSDFEHRVIGRLAGLAAAAIILFVIGDGIFS